MKNMIKKLFFKSCFYLVIFVTTTDSLAGDIGIIHPW